MRQVNVRSQHCRISEWRILSIRGTLSVLSRPSIVRFVVDFDDESRSPKHAKSTIQRPIRTWRRNRAPACLREMALQRRASEIVSSLPNSWERIPANPGVTRSGQARRFSLPHGRIQDPRGEIRCGAPSGTPCHLPSGEKRSAFRGRIQDPRGEIRCGALRHSVPPPLRGRKRTGDLFLSEVPRHFDPLGELRVEHRRTWAERVGDGTCPYRQPVVLRLVDRGPERILADAAQMGKDTSASCP